MVLMSLASPASVLQQISRGIQRPGVVPLKLNDGPRDSASCALRSASTGAPNGPRGTRPECKGSVKMANFAYG